MPGLDFGQRFQDFLGLGILSAVAERFPQAQQRPGQRALLHQFAVKLHRQLVFAQLQQQNAFQLLHVGYAFIAAFEQGGTAFQRG